MGDETPSTNNAFQAIEAKCEIRLREALRVPSNINTEEGVFKETLLHKAAQNQWKSGLRILLDNGSEIESPNYFGQTALQYAVVSKSTDCVRVLLERGNEALFNHTDGRGHSALHDAAALGLGEIVEELVVAGASVNIVDNNGLTPLHKAVNARDVKSICCLLKAGADIKAKDYLGRTGLSMMLYSHQDVFESILNGCFTESDEKSLNETRINVDFFPLINSKYRSQLDVIRDVLMCGSLKLISHPLCETFLSLQWLSLRKYFITEVCLYFVFVLLSTILILHKVVWMRVEGDFPKFVEGIVYNIFLSFVIIGAVLMLMRQCFIVVHGIRIRLISVWYILNCIIPILVLIIIPGHYTPWQNHLAAITLLLAWSQGMLHIGRFPKWGIYIAMFTTVARNLIRMFLIFFSVFIAFALSFNIICFSKHSSSTLRYNETDSDSSLFVDDVVYSNLILTFMKTLTMMTGELNFDANLIEMLNYLPGTSHCIFIAFIFLMSILLSNLLVALAVSDVQGLKDKAQVEKLFKQAELAELMETTYEVVSAILRGFSLKKISKKVYLPSIMSDHCKVYISMNNHHKCGCLVVKGNKNKTKIVNVTSHFIAMVRECSAKERERLEQRSGEKNETESVDHNLLVIKNNIQILNEKCSQMLQKMSKLEDRLENLT